MRLAPARRPQVLAGTPLDSIAVMRPGREPLDIYPLGCLSEADLPPRDGWVPGGGFQEEEEKNFCPEDPVLDTELKGLHESLHAGETRAQLLIDTRLLACWLATTAPGLYRSVPRESLVPHPASAHHHKMLPDIGRFILQSLAHRDWKTNLIVNVICNSMPCLKRNRVAFLDKDAFAHPHAAVLINILHGLLLGLYPSTAKRPAFRCRVRLAGELRALLCAPLRTQAEFLQGHLPLLKLSMMEYLWYVCGTHLTTELDAISHVHGMGTFMEICPNICDGFRQEGLQEASWTWDSLSSVAATFVERCVRTCKFRMGRARADAEGHAFWVPPWKPYPMRVVLPGITHQESFQQSLQEPLHTPGGQAFSYTAKANQEPSQPLQAPVAKWKRVAPTQSHLFEVAREMHVAQAPGVLWSVYADLHPELTVEDFHLIEHLHSRCRVHPLPCNLAATQARMLLETYGQDHAQLASVSRVHLCLRCCNKPNADAIATKLRLCMHSGRLICVSCASHLPVVAVDLLGKVLVVQGVTYYLCPICGGCKRWAFSGTEFTCVDCRHRPAPTQPRPAPRRCLHCSKTNGLERDVLLFAELGVKVQVSLCSKHALPAHVSRFVTDVGDYCRAARACQAEQAEARKCRGRRR